MCIRDRVAVVASLEVLRLHAPNIVGLVKRHDPYPKTVFEAVPGTEAGIEAEAAVRILAHSHGLAYVRTRQRQRCAVEHRTGSSCRSTQSVAQYSAVLVRLLEEIVTKLLII